MQALAVARTENARIFELRAARSLAQLRLEAGAPAEARAILEPVYETFTEGLQRPDMLEARALLAQLP